MKKTLASIIMCILEFHGFKGYGNKIEYIVDFVHSGFVEQVIIANHPHFWSDTDSNKFCK